MAYLDPVEAFEHFRDRTLEAVSKQFPVDGRLQTLRLDRLEVQDDKSPFDLREQHEAKVSGNTWGVPVIAHFTLVDKATGKETKAKTRIAELPKITRRYSQIVNGQEYQVDNQWQLKPGAYVRRRTTGQIETQFQSAKHSFDVTFDDETKEFRLDYRKAKLPLYPILKTLGVSDEHLEKMWGKQIFEANKSLRKSDSAVDQFYRTSKRGAAPPSHAEAEKHLIDTLKSMQLRPDVTELTLGKAIDHVNGDALTRASTKMLKVQAGAPPDDRDSLVFKDLRSVGDFAYDKIMAAAPTIRGKILRKLNTAASPRDIIRFDVFNKPVRETFFKNAASQVAKQVNPVEMVSTAQQTTVMGPGGIQSEQQILDEVKFVNPTHMAFLDPIHTPEGCFDAETEVLTHRGWLPWPTVTGEEQLACLVNGRLEFEHPLALVAAPFDGELMGIDTTRVKKRGSKPLKYLITPNHRVWSRPIDGAGYRIERADEMHGKMRVFQTGHAPYLGTETSWYQLPRVAGNNSSKNVAAIEIGDWAEFMGWFLSEGHVAYDEETSSYHVKLFQSDLVGKDGCARIEALLEGMPFVWSRRERENKRMVYSISTKQLAHYMSQFGGSYDKFIPEEAFEWPLIARQRLLWALMRGDGRLTQTRGGQVMTNEVYTTTSEQLALGVERLIISLGMTAKVRQYEDKREERYKDVYEIRVFQNPERHVQKSHLDSYYTQKYKGMVYCAEVPGGLVYVRRAGSIGYWSGNSRTGVTLRMPISVRKHGNEPQVPLFNVRTGKMEYVGPKTFLQSKVALPDQVSWEDGKPKPNSATVKISGNGNDVTDAPFKDVDYVMRHSSQFFNITSNLIPFIGNTSGGRASMATRHMEQAISLKHREAPLVQVGTGSSKDGVRTFEEVVGTQASHQSRHTGVVKAIKSDAIVITDKNGKDHESQIYRNYPLNDSKSVLDSTPLVKVGDHVKEGQTIADTNYSKNGAIALGTNLRVGYIPYKGYNFEDGIVISESAAQKLASLHLHKNNVPVDADTVLHKKRYVVQHPSLYSRAQLEHIGEDGIVKVGTHVTPGDPLVLSMKKTVAQDRTGLSAIRKSLGESFADKSLTWSGEAAGEVVSAFRQGDDVIVHVKSVEPMQVGDKLAGRYGNKGIVTKIVADKEMPHTPDGAHIEVALNPSGVPGRMNIGQVLETAASKIAKKTGQTYVVQNFNGGNQLEKVQAELKKHGISDVEELYDPTTSQKLGTALVGFQHMVKLHHQVDKKVSVRSGMNLPGHETEKYDSNLQPSGGGHTGGQSMDPLGLYSLLAHGARANIREMQTWKSEGPDPQASPQKQWQSQHHDVWDAIQHGDPLPLPKPTFAFRKFTDMLMGAGINMEKQGHKFVLSPLTDKHIAELTGDRVLPKPAEMLYAKVDPKTGDPKPKTGGLFDEKLTGGHGGKKWSRMTLAEPVPNPVFEDSIRILTGLTKDTYADVVNGDKAISKSGSVVELGHGLTGGHGIQALLDKLDVDKDLVAARSELKTVASSKVDKVLKKVKRLQALKDAGMTPSEAYVLHSLPIIPPALRPVSVMPDGNFNFADINQLYSQFAQNNDQLNDPTLKSHLTDHDKKDLRRGLYDGMKAIMGVGVPYKEAEHKGLIHQIAGDTPKTGYFQSTLISRKQDMSMRSTIVPEPSLSLDEVGLPKEHALRLFAPFVVAQLKKSGVADNVADAQKMVAKGSPIAYRALNRVMEERPVMLKRDPALHKYSVQAFRPKVVEGNAIKIHPLVTGGYNADFDGDTMSVFVPISSEAVHEAQKMFPSNNLFNEASGKVMYQPTLESALGLYKLTRVTDKKPHVVDHPAHAISAVKSGKISVNDPVKLGDMTTTTGRILLSAALPEPMQKNVLTNFDFKFDKKGLDKVLTEVAKNHQSDFGAVADKLKDIGNGASSGVVTVEHSGYIGANRLEQGHRVHVPVGVHTLGLSDFTPDTVTRESVLVGARKDAAKVKANKGLTEKESDSQLVQIWSAADREIKEKHLAKAVDNPNNLLTMHLAGVKPGWGQYKQMTLAPMLVEDAAGRVIPTPITNSYSEGLDTGEYWTQMHGARRGSVLKVQQVRDPGYLSKLLMANTMDMLVTGKDCGTTRGISLPVTDRDVTDRYLQKDFTAKGLTVPAGTLLTSSLVGKMRAADKSAHIVVRSPLKCEHAKGLCQHCVGLGADGQHHDMGDNVGVTSAQALGERAVQLTLRVFHTGGTVDTSGGSKVLGGFERFNQLMTLPKTIQDSATLAMRSGTIDKVEKDATGVNVFIGGKKHHVGKDSSGTPLWHPIGKGTTSWQPPKAGMKVEKGQQLSDPARTLVNPHDLYKATDSIESVQNYLADEVYGLYKDEGIKRQHVETVVKAMSNLTKIDEPGDYDGVLRGEFHPTSVIHAVNRDLVKNKKSPILHTPVLKGVDMMPLSLREDWMAKLQHQRLSQTLLEAAATNGKTDLHGLHPVPGMAFGAEFGLNKSHVKGRPALSHLHDVDEVGY